MVPGLDVSFPHLLPAGEQSDVCADLVCAGPEAAEARHQVSVNLPKDMGAHGSQSFFLFLGLPGVSLPGYDKTAVKISFSSYQLVEVLHLVVISVKQLEEGGLGARGPFHPPKPEAIPDRPEVFLIHEKFLEPETSSLT